MNQLTLYNKIIYCQFCKKYYYQNIFKQHLQFCTTYLQYINKYQKDIHKLTYNTNDINISYNSDPNLFLSLVKNKRVIIVGPSITVQECNLGNFINNFDIIVRLNKSLPVPIKMYQHVGCRTDILYNSLNTSDYPGENNISPLFLKQQKIKYLRCPYPPITPFKEDIKSFYKKNINIINFGHIDTNYYKKLEYGLGTRPYTGTCAIADLLHCQVKELFVMGIDFYTYKHSFYYRNVSSVKLKKLQNNNIHQRKPQIDLIRRFYLLDNRLVVDNILDEILLENYDSLLHGIKSNIDFEKIFLTGEGKYKKSKEAIDIFLNTKVCIVGELNCDDIQKNKYKDIGLIIDLLPNRNNPIREESVKIVYRNTSNFDEYHNDKDVLFTQVYRYLGRVISFGFKNDCLALCVYFIYFVRNFNLYCFLVCCR